MAIRASPQTGSARVPHWLLVAALVLISLPMFGLMLVVPESIGVAWWGKQTWRATGSLHTARAAQPVVLLPNGDVLALTGISGDIAPVAERYDPAHGAWRLTSQPSILRGAVISATLLQDGRVLVVSSIGTSQSAELYEPRSERWTPTAPMPQDYMPWQTVLLEDGSVLALCGYTRERGRPAITRVQRYEPALDRWSTVASMLVARGPCTAVRLRSGQVLVLGGQGDDVYRAVEIYSPVTDSWRRGADRPIELMQTVTELDDGTVLVTGGGAAVRYDLVADTWHPAGTLKASWNYAAVKLADGRVLVVGGEAVPSPLPPDDVLAGRVSRDGVLDALPYDLNETTIYDPATNQWYPAESMGLKRRSPTAVLLKDGTVLVMGGKQPLLPFPMIVSTRELTSSELYTPRQ